MNDDDGPQRREVIWMLENIRRSVSVLYIYDKKNKPISKEDIDGIFNQIKSIISAIGDGPV